MMTWVPKQQKAEVRGKRWPLAREQSVHTTSGASVASDIVPATDPPGTPAPPAGHAGHR